MTKKLFMTGGTGLVGKWLIQILKQQYPDIEITVLTRYPEVNAHLDVNLVKGDVETIQFPAIHYDYIIHGAVDGTKKMLDFAQWNNAEMLYTSSGAVYGKFDKAHVPIPEYALRYYDSLYAQKKLEGEIACQKFPQAKIVRLFAFAGKWQPLDYHYAIGNFIRDGLEGGPIKLRGGTDIYRSYLHYSEMAEWILAVLFRGDAGPYNIGSEQAISIHDLAYDVAKAFGCEVEESDPMTNLNAWYIPDTSKIRRELGVTQKLFYPEVMQRMIEEVRNE